MDLCQEILDISIKSALFMDRDLKILMISIKTVDFMDWIGTKQAFCAKTQSDKILARYLFLYQLIASAVSSPFMRLYRF